MSAPIVVFVEHTADSARRASLECVGAAHGTGHPVVAVLSGAGADAVAPSLGAAGASKVVTLPGREAFSPDGLAADLAGVVKEHSARGFLCAATIAGKDVAPRVAAHLDCVLFTDCTGLEVEGDDLRVTRPWLAGKAIAVLRSNAPILCATTRPNVFPTSEGGGDAEVTGGSSTDDVKVTVTGLAEKSGGKLDVKEAPVVVSGGRGLKEPGGFSIVEDLADAFGDAAVGASRAVVDLGWRPHGEQVGQTGKTVQPQLYVAIGISGAIQHLAGMKTAKVIVAINKDPEAPIFKVADYGIVGDAFEIVPKLAEAVRAVKAKA